MIDLNFGPVGERINSAGSDLSLGCESRRGSASSMGSTDDGRVPSSDRQTKLSRHGQSESLRRRNQSIELKNENGTEKRVSSAGSDSDSSLSSTLKAETPRTLNIDLSVTNLDHEDSITYEQLQSMIETVLVECGYYSVSPQGRERTPPHRTLVPDSVRNRLLTSSHLMSM